MQATSAAATKDGLRVVIYPGGTKILLAMSLDDDKVENLAGFAIWRTAAGKEIALANRLTFTAGVSKQSTAPKWTPSSQAPFQKFRWVDVPPDGFSAPLSYRIKALYFTGHGTAMRDGPEVSLAVSPAAQRHSKFQPAFTRGYIASQAYADRFHNKDIRPSGPHTPTFSTQPFQAQYKWLGADARQRLLDFIADCKNDSTAQVNVFAYDLDEPDIVKAICDFGKQKRLKAILDNAPLHTKPDKQGKPPPEVAAAKLIIAAAGTANVKQGKFARFQHNKVFIKRDQAGAAQKVLFGSMNFSVRGVYVQANNVIVVDDPKTAGMFAQAFDEAFKDDVKAPPFRSSALAKGYMVGSPTNTAELPKFSLALSPHADPSISLGPMSQRIRAATSSVLFAVMEPNGTGPVLTTLQQIAAKPAVFSYGTVETDKGLAVQSPNGAMGDLTGFAALTKNVPPPFNKEFSGGPGKHIHDKFVVVDFNAANPTVFTGSSNLAAGGEQDNGDSLAMIEDASIATMYALEAVAMFDHYHFNKKANAATTAKPLTLWSPGKSGTPWWKEYYDKTKIQTRDRCLFANVPLPAGMDATKTVDWSAVDSSTPASGAKKKAAPPKKRKAAAPARKRLPTRRKAAAPRKKAAAKKAPANRKAAPKKKRARG
ncbi:MAG TPA: phospholipase D-like domain-containing protein [Acetobacteraceae bacterium]|nr:phospholipase D-like domain-containing protein [Acetobacteraceae bacterium]